MAAPSAVFTQASQGGGAIFHQLYTHQLYLIFASHEHTISRPKFPRHELFGRAILCAEVETLANHAFVPTY